MKYADRLSTLAESQTQAGTQPAKPAKAPFAAFDATTTPPIPKNTAEFRHQYARAREATSEEACEIRQMLAMLLPGMDHPDYPEALALALASPDAHLEGLRGSRPPATGEKRQGVSSEQERKQARSPTVEKQSSTFK